jgi:hypothetical protein
MLFNTLRHSSSNFSPLHFCPPLSPIQLGQTFRAVFMKVDSRLKRCLGQTYSLKLCYNILHLQPEYPEGLNTIGMTV